ncbi:hypothetical protein EVAR_67683_1 [Eumeta japonica]|uniref:Uncharacterized protein n=1 Tax=Eumeta variegata TaxID=151549 RepID=A0A4C1ZM74_EUMVA|nr:hypothetical protein EVAR_67683_1 [Eumeta japonica]
MRKRCLCYDRKIQDNAGGSKGSRLIRARAASRRLTSAIQRCLIIFLYFISLVAGIKCAIKTREPLQKSVLNRRPPPCLPPTPPDRWAARPIGGGRGAPAAPPGRPPPPPRRSAPQSIPKRDRSRT